MESGNHRAQLLFVEKLDFVQEDDYSSLFFPCGCTHGDEQVHEILGQVAVIGNSFRRGDI